MHGILWLKNCTFGVISQISPDLDVVYNILPNLQKDNIASKLIDIKRFTKVSVFIW